MHYARWKRHGVAEGRTAPCCICGTAVDIDGAHGRRGDRHLLCGDPECRRIRSQRRERARIYGLTEDAYESLMREQDGVCAICGIADGKTSVTTGRAGLHVDHDHATDAVRGLLCSGCNVGLGHFLDNPALLRRAVDYLERHFSLRN